MSKPRALDYLALSVLMVLEKYLYKNGFIHTQIRVKASATKQIDKLATNPEAIVF
jgi:hypothetical protein